MPTQYYASLQSCILTLTHFCVGMIMKGRGQSLTINITAITQLTHTTGVPVFESIHKVLTIALKIWLVITCCHCILETFY